MSRRIRFERKAAGDLERLIDFLNSLSPKAARRAAAAIRKEINTLTLFPDAWPQIAMGVRQMAIPFGDSGYVVQYRVDPEHVVIARVFHMREQR